MQNIIYDLARMTGTTTKEHGREIIFKSCPYCHGGTHNDKETFSINVQTGQFECKRGSCGKSGNILTICKDFDLELPESVKNEQTRFIETQKEYKTPDQNLETTTKDAYKYFEDRGISKQIVDKYKITTQKGKPNILEIPFIDDKGKVTLIKCRKTDFEPEKDKSKEWYKESGYKPILFGMKQCDVSNKTLIMTEGQIDSLSVAECGFQNVVSVPNGKNGFTWTENCIDWLKNFHKLIVFGDYENGTISLLDQMKKIFKGKVFNVSPENYRRCKDANELLCKFGKDSVKYAIEHAEKTQVSDCIISLADIKPRHYEEKDFIKTGIDKLDHILGGGLCKGEIVCLTGKSGEGKSTFSSQLVANMINDNKKVLVYSGELLPETYQRWLNFQLSGKENVTFNESGLEYKNHINKECENKIVNWCRDKVFLIDSIKNDLKDEPENILDLIRIGVIQNDIDFVVIDNLMTAMQENLGTELYTRQSQFVGELCKLAFELNVSIMLVAHPRKTTNGTNDDVSGSGDITNKSAIVIHYSKPSDSDYKKHSQKQFFNAERTRLLSVTKNRHNGRLAQDKESIVTMFEPETKRIEQIVTIEKEGNQILNINRMFKKQYNWVNWKKETGQTEIEMGV